MKRLLLALALLFASAHAHADTAIGSSGSFTPATANSCATGKVCLWYDSINLKLKLRVSGSDMVGFGSLQDIYNNGPAGIQVITLNGTNLGVRIVDSTPTTGGSIFSILDSTAATFYLRIATGFTNRLVTPAPNTGAGFVSDTINDFTGSGFSPWVWNNQGNLLFKLVPLSGPNTALKLGGAGSTISENGGGAIAAVYTNAVPTTAPTVLASGATITPTQMEHYVSGVATINTISVASLPSSFSGQILLIPQGAWSTGLAGNIANVITATANVPIIAVYDSGAAKWYVK